MGGMNLFSKTADVWHLGSSAETSVEMSAVLSSGSRADAVTSVCVMVQRSKAAGAKREEGRGGSHSYQLFLF